MTMLFTYPGNEKLAGALLENGGIEAGKLTLHHFPDGETLVKIDTAVKGKKIVLLCTLDRADEKAMALLFFSQTARNMGASSIGLIAPYLGYMRQDKKFHDGEAVTADIFAAFLSRHFDSLITVDPHLHRHKTMGEIYSIPATVVHAADAIATWIGNNVERPVLIGPDEESAQWVFAVAAKVGAPFTVLVKTRSGDSDVKVSIPDIEKFRDHTPVLVDDIISTARTMIETVRHLRAARMKPPVCIGIHAVFAGSAYEDLKSRGAGRIVTCNTIAHESNAIDISKPIASGLPSRPAR